MNYNDFHFFPALLVLPVNYLMDILHPKVHHKIYVKYSVGSNGYSILNIKYN